MPTKNRKSSKRKQRVSLLQHLCRRYQLKEQSLVPMADELSIEQFEYCLFLDRKLGNEVNQVLSYIDAVIIDNEASRLQRVVRPATLGGYYCELATLLVECSSFIQLLLKKNTCSVEEEEDRLFALIKGKYIHLSDRCKEFLQANLSSVKQQYFIFPNFFKVISLLITMEQLAQLVGYDNCEGNNRLVELLLDILPEGSQTTLATFEISSISYFETSEQKKLQQQVQEDPYLPFIAHVNHYRWLFFALQFRENDAIASTDGSVKLLEYATLLSCLTSGLVVCCAWSVEVMQEHLSLLQAVKTPLIRAYITRIPPLTMSEMELLAPVVFTYLSYSSLDSAALAEAMDVQARALLQFFHNLTVFALKEDKRSLVNAALKVGQQSLSILLVQQQAWPMLAELLSVRLTIRKEPEFGSMQYKERLAFKKLQPWVNFLAQLDCFYLSEQGMSDESFLQWLEGNVESCQKVLEHKFVLCLEWPEPEIKRALEVFLNQIKIHIDKIMGSIEREQLSLLVLLKEHMRWASYVLSERERVIFSQQIDGYFSRLTYEKVAEQWCWQEGPEKPGRLHSPIEKKKNKRQASFSPNAHATASPKPAVLVRPTITKEMIEEEQLPHELMVFVEQIQEHLGQNTFLTGGAVASLLSQKGIINDYDLLIPNVETHQLLNVLHEIGYQEARLIGKAKPIICLKLIDRLSSSPITLDISCEIFPSHIEQEAMKELLERRDFKLSALYINLCKRPLLVQGFNRAIRSVNVSRIEAVSHPFYLFLECPARLLRLVKIHLSYPNFDIHQEILNALIKLRPETIFSNRKIVNGKIPLDCAHISTQFQSLFGRFDSAELFVAFKRLSIFKVLIGFSHEDTNKVELYFQRLTVKEQDGYQKTVALFQAIAITLCQKQRYKADPVVLTEQPCYPMLCAVKAQDRALLNSIRLHYRETLFSSSVLFPAPSSPLNQLLTHIRREEYVSELAQNLTSQALDNALVKLGKYA